MSLSPSKASSENKPMKRRIKVFLAALLIAIVGFLLPERFRIPVQHAGPKDWNPQSFWYYPWGRSGVHKGVDIFAKKGTATLAAVDSLVIYAGEIDMGGKVVLALGPRWKLHYYAHLDRIDVSALDWLSSGEPLGQVGDSGNAKGKPPHLHYSILRVLPLPWKMDQSIQGYKKAFYQDPTEYLNAASSSRQVSPIR
jgi:peptidoglycan LD-endopeptidase LytH